MYDIICGRHVLESYERQSSELEISKASGAVVRVPKHFISSGLGVRPPAEVKTNRLASLDIPTLRRVRLTAGIIPALLEFLIADLPGLADWHKTGEGLGRTGTGWVGLENVIW